MRIFNFKSINFFWLLAGLGTAAFALDARAEQLTISDNSVVDHMTAIEVIDTSSITLQNDKQPKHKGSSGLIMLFGN